MKKALSLVLSLLMLFSLMIPAIPVAAEGEAPDVFQIGEDKYKTVADLAAAVNASTSPDPVEVKMIADYIGCTERDKLFTHAFTLDAQNHEIKNEVGQFYLMHFYAAGTFTIKNLKYTYSHGFRMYTPNSGDMEVVFENVTANLYGTGLFTNQQTKDGTESGTNTLTIKNTTISTPAGKTGDPVLAVYDDKNNVTINMIDSTITHNREYNSNSGNNPVITVNANAKTTINLQGSTIINRRTLGATTGAIFFLKTPANVKVNLDNETELKIDNAANGYYCDFVYNNAVPAEWNDAGATYTISARSLKTGATLPVITSLKGDSASAIVYKSTVGDKTVVPGFGYGDHSATADISFKAETTTGTKVTAATKPFRIGTTYYDTMTAATAAVTAGQTIELVRNYTGAEAVVDLTRNAGGFTVEGNGLTFVNKTGYFFFIAKSGVKFQNITIGNTNQGFSVNPQAANTTLDFNNVYAYNYGGLLMAFGHSKNTNSGNGIVTLTDSYFQGGGEEPILMQNLDQTLNLVNSTVVSKATGSSHFFVINFADQAHTYTLNADATSKLILATATAGNLLNAQGSKGSVSNVNLAAGATLKMEGTPAGSMFVKTSGTSTINLTDNGASYVANAAAQKNGFVLPNVGNATKTMLGFKSGASSYKPGSTFKDTAATADKTFTAEFFTKADFANMDGASIRIADDEYSPAVRFSTTITTALYDQLVALDANVKFGTLLADASTFTGNAITGATAKVAKDITVWDANTAEGTKRFNSAVFNIQEANYESKIAATGYFTVTYSDASTATFYAAFDATKNERSLKEVAQAAYDAGNTANAVINGILG